MTNKNNVIEISNLTYIYKKNRKKIVALNNINLNIKEGETVAFIGPDGVGKSTLFDIISTEKKIQKKTHFNILGNSVLNSKHKNKILSEIAYMPQGLGKNLYFDLTVYENIKYFSDLFNININNENSIKELMERTDLYEFRNRKAKNLSGGMKQKLGLCCSLIHTPKILILDEPTTGVDPLSRLNFWNLIFDIKNKNKNMTIIVSTAYMEEAKKFDRIIMMNDGQIIADGTEQEILDKTNKPDLDSSFIELLPIEKKGNHKTFDITPLNTENKETIIEAKNLTRKFGNFTAVDHINFNIKQGEIYAFLGPNGCGKSTTMKMLVGLLPSTEGERKIFNSYVKSDIMRIKKDIGYMSQNFSLYTELTVMGNLKLHATIFDLSKRDSHNRINYIVKYFKLEDILNEKTGELPLGIKQRLSLAVAVLHQPSILILDEPTSGVDPIARDEFWELIVKLSREEGVTIFITTHYLNEAMRCDRVAMMNAGRLLANGTPNEIIKDKKAKNRDSR